VGKHFGKQPLGRIGRWWEDGQKSVVRIEVTEVMPSGGFWCHQYSIFGFCNHIVKSLKVIMMHGKKDMPELCRRFVPTIY
jgi:hypothetical protein